MPNSYLTLYDLSGGGWDCAREVWQGRFASRAISRVPFARKPGCTRNWFRLPGQPMNDATLFGPGQSSGLPRRK